MHPHRLEDVNVKKHARRHMFPHIRAKDGKHPRIHHDYVRFPKVDIMARSWDFVPSDVVRPLAITTVSAVAVATRRLGMIWKQFEPSTGAFHAEGNHQDIASTAIRGLGTVADSAEHNLQHGN